MGIEHWINVPLGSVATYINGRAFKPTEWETKGYPIIRIQNLTKSTDIINYTTKIFEDKYLVDNGDVLMAWSATLDVFIWNEGPAWLNQHIFNVKEFSNIITKKFLYYSLKQATSDFYTKTHGSGMVHVTKPIFESHEILLPPLNEQKRIVAKLDQIMPRIAAVKDWIDKVPSIIKRFRQSVLTAAVTGKLTEKWRAENPDVENAEKLLQEIKNDKLTRNLVECNVALKDSKSKHKKSKSIDKEVDIDSEISTWKWDYLLNVAEIAGGVTKGRNLDKFKTCMFPYLRVANVQDGFLNLSEIKFIKIKNNEIDRYRLKNGDILFTEGGDRDKLGRGCVWKDEIENCLHQNHIFRARVNQNLIKPEYISIATKSDYSKKYFDGVANQTVNLASINMTNLGLLPIPIPPYKEQEEIVLQVKKLFALADRLESHYQKAKVRVDKLSQSVLAKAFRGELVITEAELAEKEGRDYESAEKLLERIKIEKAKIESRKQKKA